MKSLYICAVKNDPMEKRVVVTGLGVLSCIGNDVPSFWNSLVNGVCGIDYITEFPTDGLPVKIAGKIRNFDPTLYGMDKAFIRKQDPFTIFASSPEGSPPTSAQASEASRPYSARSAK